MADEDTQSIFYALLERVCLLASPNNVQEEWLQSKDEPLDELRLSLLDVGSELFPLYRESELLDSEGELSVLKLEEHLNSLSERNLMRDWLYLKDTTDWDVTRSLARDAIKSLETKHNS